MPKEAIKPMTTKKPTHTARTSTALVVVAFVLLTGALFSSVGPEALAQGSDADKEAGHPQVTGFRSARFGMSKSETLEAMRHDFQLLPEDVETQPNDEDRTSSLVATVEDLFPGSGPARVFYIHGYKWEELFQVNILWGVPVTEDPDPQLLVTNANVLRRYFAQQGFDPETTVMNTRVDDSVFIVFRATDALGRMVLLQLISGKAPAAEGEEEAEPQDRVVSLLLSYIENLKDPDVFRIEKGTF